MPRSRYSRRPLAALDSEADNHRLADRGARELTDGDRVWAKHALEVTLEEEGKVQQTRHGATTGAEPSRALRIPDADVCAPNCQSLASRLESDGEEGPWPSVLIERGYPDPRPPKDGEE